MTRDDWRQSVPDAETFDQLFERAKRKSEVPAAPRFGINAVRVPPRPTPRSAPRLQARVVLNPERAVAAPDKAAEAPRAAPASLRFGAPPLTPPLGPKLPAPVLPPGIESFADVLDDDPPRPRKGLGAAPAATPLAPRFAAPPVIAPRPVAPPPAAVRFGPPPPEPAPARVETLPPPRRQLVTLPFLQKRSLSTGGSIVVSALTASMVVGVAFGIHAWRQPATPPLTNTTRDALLSAPAANAPTSAAVTIAAVPEAVVKSAPAPVATVTAEAAPPPSELPPGYGRLTVQSPREADVYLTGKRVGPANLPLDVRCGTWFVRLGRPGDDFPPEWVGTGETVRVACQASTTVELGPGQSSLVLKRSPR